MKLTLLLGRANTGKSSAITQRLAAHQRAGERAYLIVPEQYTFEAERSLSSALRGLLGVQVMSFDRLNERVLQLAGYTQPFLSEQGCRMVIRRSAIKNRDRLTAFSAVADRAGFCADLNLIFTDLKRAGVSPEMLQHISDDLPEGPLKGKLVDVALLYGETEAFLKDRYLTLDDAANTACELLPHSFLKGAPVYIDGIDRPSAQLYRWLEQLMLTAGSLTVALCCDPAPDADAELFLPALTIVSRLRDMADRLAVPCVTERFTACAAPVDDALSYLERNLFAVPSKPYAGDAAAVTVFGASDRLSETEALGNAILELARRGVRYREMAVIVSDPEAYLDPIARVFERRGIPVFLDRKRPVTGHAAVTAVLAALSAIVDHFPATDVLRLVKSGYAGVSQQDAEALELYLIRTGLRGSALAKPFARAPVDLSAERAREAVMSPLLQLREKLHERKLSGKVRALYEYLEQIGLQDALHAEAEELFRLGRIRQMEEHAQVWNALTSLLSQLDAILGDTDASREQFYALLTEGLSGLALGVVPGTSDQVLVGDLARTKSRAVRALFLVGVNDGLLPRPRGDDGLIDDAELQILSGAGMPVWPSVQARAADDRLDLYAALSKAHDYLTLSYSFSGDGAELSASALVSDVLRLLPSCRLQTDILASDRLPCCVQEGMQMLSSELSAFHGGNAPTVRMTTLLKYFLARPDTASRVRRMRAAGSLRFAPAPFGRTLARALYGSDVSMSASRLEQFASCPFKHFMRYGLAAADKKEYTERAADLGTFYHAALDAFVRAVQSAGGSWETLSDADCDAIVDRFLPDVIANHNDGIFLHNERLHATLFLLVESVRQSVRAVVMHMRAGSFTPIGAEVRFGEGGAFPPLTLRLSDGVTATLSGVIDRVDRAPLPEGHALRVVDYKLGGREFDLTGILHGLTLQLPLYLLAATQSGGTPVGMYYMPLTVPAASDAEDLNESVTEAFRLNGLTLSAPDIVLCSDRGCIGGDSSILKGVKRTSDEVFSGRVASTQEFDDLLKLSLSTSKKLFSSMLDGHVEADPTERACAYCDYMSACRFDPMVRGCRTRKYAKIKQADFFAMIGGDDRAVDD